MKCKPTNHTAAAIQAREMLASPNDWKIEDNQLHDPDGSVVKLKHRTRPDTFIHVITLPKGEK